MNAQSIFCFIKWVLLDFGKKIRLKNSSVMRNSIPIMLIAYFSLFFSEQYRCYLDVL
jgi:hypothetical protein